MPRAQLGGKRQDGFGHVPNGIVREMTVAADEAYRLRIDATVAEFAAHKRSELAGVSADLTEFVDAAAEFVAGGKRLRALFCRAGWLVAGGDPEVTAFDHAAASLEWLQGSALAHDDLMDGSDTRRGRPSLHRRFEHLHRTDGFVGDAAQFGASAAILIGDLMLSWVDEQFRLSGLPRTLEALPWLDRCKTEVAAGQYLDVLAQARGTFDIDHAMLVVRFKSAKYTVERPLHLGAALAGASDTVMTTLSTLALPLGEAFQLRDDVLGVFGDPGVTGKPAGDDLREGKTTVLIAKAAELGTADDRIAIRALLGTPEGVGELTSLIERTGALDAVEADIARLEAAADAALAELPAGADEILGALVRSTTRRVR